MNELSPLKICTLGNLTGENLKWARLFVPNLRTRKNKYRLEETDYQYHTCYVIINLVNGKCYFGKHSFDYDPKKIGYSVDYWGTSKHLKNSMKYHGMENFRMLILKYFPTWQDAYAYETKLITLEMIQSKYCYNLQGGGKGYAGGKFHHIHEKVRNGTHGMWVKDVNGLTINQRKVKLGTHNFLTDENGNSVGKDTQLRLVAEGIHHCLKDASGDSLGKRRTAEGKNPWTGKTKWDNFKSTKESLFTWYVANILHTIVKKVSNVGEAFITNVGNKILKESVYKLSQPVVGKILQLCNTGWDPENDRCWRWFKRKVTIDKYNLVFLDAISSEEILFLHFLNEIKAKLSKEITPWENSKNRNNKQRNLPWYLADKIYKLYLRYPELSNLILSRKVNTRLNLKETYGFELSGHSLVTLRLKFKSGWVPKKDPYWEKFKSAYTTIGE